MLWIEAGCSNSEVAKATDMAEDQIMIVPCPAERIAAVLVSGLMPGQASITPYSMRPIDWVMRLRSPVLRPYLKALSNGLTWSLATRI